MSIIDNEAVLLEVTEQLNKILLKLDGVGRVPFVYNDDYDGRKTIGKEKVDSDGDTEVIVDAEVELACIKDAIKIILNNTKWAKGSVSLLEDYYDSSCY